MNPFEVFSTEEIEKINDISETIEKREYTKEEWCRMENSILDHIMSKSSKNGDIDTTRNEFSNILDKIEIYRG